MGSIGEGERDRERVKERDYAIRGKRGQRGIYPLPTQLLLHCFGVGTMAFLFASQTTPKSTTLCHIHALGNSIPYSFP